MTETQRYILALYRLVDWYAGRYGAYGLIWLVAAILSQRGEKDVAEKLLAVCRNIRQQG